MPTKPPPAARRPRSTNAARREQTLAAALAVFSDEGFAAATMDEIAARARISKATLYAWFGSKDRLFETLILRSLGPADVTEALDRPGDLEAKLTAIAEQILAATTAPKTVALLRVALSEAARFPRLKSRMRESLERPAFVDWLGRLRDSGQLAFDDPAEAAALFVSMAQGDWTVRALYGVLDKDHQSKLQDYARFAARMFLKAMAPPSATDHR
jgi:AcrR family transcriptional regulator